MDTYLKDIPKELNEYIKFQFECYGTTYHEGNKICDIKYEDLKNTNMTIGDFVDFLNKIKYYLISTTITDYINNKKENVINHYEFIIKFDNFSKNKKSYDMNTELIDIPKEFLNNIKEKIRNSQKIIKFAAYCGTSKNKLEVLLKRYDKIYKDETEVLFVILQIEKFTLKYLVERLKECGLGEIGLFIETYINKNNE